MAIETVGYVTRYYARRKGILAMHEYRTKSLTAMHAQIRKDTGGETMLETFDREAYRATGGLLGTTYERVEGCDPDERHAAARKQATTEHAARRRATMIRRTARLAN